MYNKEYIVRSCSREKAKFNSELLIVLKSFWQQSKFLFFILLYFFARLRDSTCKNVADSETERQTEKDTERLRKNEKKTRIKREDKTRRDEEEEHELKPKSKTKNQICY